jgi:thiamine-phosphate pyrophosphorylase
MTNQTSNFNAAKPRLYLLLTRSLCKRDPLQTLEEAIVGGVDLVQIREKPLTRGDFAWIQEVWDLCKAHQIPLVLNDRIDFAKELGIRIVHLGQEDLQEIRGEYRRRTLGEMQWGLSTHSLEEVEFSLKRNPSYIGIGPCFATPTKGYRQGLSHSLLKAMQSLANNYLLPAFAIGGIHSENLNELMKLGVRRIAVSSCILGAEKPHLAAQKLKVQLETASLRSE